MSLRCAASCGLISAVFALVACDEGRKAPPKVTFRVVNAAPGFAKLDYIRERPPVEKPFPLPYKGANEYRYDVDTYDFYVYDRWLDVPDYTPRTWTFLETLEPDFGYTLVLAERAGEVQPVFLEYPALVASDAQIVGLHAAPGLPGLDLYLERPGVGIAGATPRGTFNEFEQIAPRTLASGDYELWLTEAGNPANVLLATTTFSLADAATSTIVVVPEFGQAGSPLSVVLVRDEPIGLFDRNVTGDLRAINGATDGVSRDFAINSEFSPPVFSAVPFASATTYASVLPTTQTINVTPVGNPGVLELNQQIAPAPGQRSTVLFAGPAGMLTHSATADDGRRLHNQAKLLLMNAATQFSGVNFLITPVGSTAVVLGDSLAAPGTSMGYRLLSPGDYDLHLVSASTGAQINEPARVTLASGGIYGALAINGTDSATAGLSLFDDFAIR
jgi:hypothetical protein